MRSSVFEVSPSQPEMMTSFIEAAQKRGFEPTIEGNVAKFEAKAEESVWHAVDEIRDRTEVTVTIDGEAYPCQKLPCPAEYMPRSMF